jgi:hypothetical protein
MTTNPNPSKRDVAGILRLLTPQQMAEEIVRLDAVLAGHPNILIGRLPPPPAVGFWLEPGPAL